MTTTTENSAHPKKTNYMICCFAGLVLFAILLVLVAQFVQTNREAARQMQCSGRLKQIICAMQTYHEVYGTFPPAYTVDADGNRMHSWRVLLLPFIEQFELYDKIRLDEPWDSEHNRQFHGVTISQYRCPTHCLRFRFEKAAATGLSNFVAITGPGTAFDDTNSVSYRQFERGVSNTVLLIEIAEAVPWMAPIDMPVEATGIGIVSSDNGVFGIGSFHPGGANAAWADGHTEFLTPEKYPPQRLREAAGVRNPLP